MGLDILSTRSDLHVLSCLDEGRAFNSNRIRFKHGLLSIFCRQSRSHLPQIWATTRRCKRLISPSGKSTQSLRPPVFVGERQPPITVVCALCQTVNPLPLHPQSDYRSEANCRLDAASLQPKSPQRPMLLRAGTIHSSKLSHFQPISNRLSYSSYGTHLPVCRSLTPRTEGNSGDQQLLSTLGAFHSLRTGNSGSNKKKNFVAPWEPFCQKRLWRLWSIVRIFQVLPFLCKLACMSNDIWPTVGTL